MKHRIMTILGTRPEIIRLSRIIPQLDELSDHCLVHTGQNYDANLSDIFFQQLGLREPDVQLNSRGTIGQQLATVMAGVESAIQEFQPDRVLVLGDTNSALAAIVAERMGVPVFHMEAGNRCYDLSVPEEKNRRLVDSISTINLPYTELSRQNLLREGANNQQIFVTGNPIQEVLCYYEPQIAQSTVLTQLGLEPDKYILVTAHRAENVDNTDRLDNIMQALTTVSEQYPVIFSCHPRTRQRLGNRSTSTNLKLIDPQSFFSFVHLEQHSFMAITDSGTVQEEMCLFHKPTVTIRHTTERPETVWCGSNLVSGLQSTDIVQAVDIMARSTRDWCVPPEYARTNVSQTVINILLGNHV